MSRFFALLYGLTAYLLFLAAFLSTIAFVEGGWGFKTLDSGTVGDPWFALLVDVALLGLFALQHSVMARRSFKRWWTTIVPEVVERSTFVLAASLAVVLLIWQWRPMPELVWAAQGEAPRALLTALSGLGWLLVLFSTFLINHFELFGLQQVYHHWRRERFKAPAFKTPALYRVVRHPLYLGFIVAFWATPQMSGGHLLFAMATTGYIFIGIFFEERDLITRFGDEYRRYRRRVPALLPRLFGEGDRTPQPAPDRGALR